MFPSASKIWFIQGEKIKPTLSARPKTLHLIFLGPRTLFQQRKGKQQVWTGSLVKPMHLDLWFLGLNNSYTGWIGWYWIWNYCQVSYNLESSFWLLHNNLISKFSFRTIFMFHMCKSESSNINYYDLKFEEVHSHQ